MEKEITLECDLQKSLVKEFTSTVKQICSNNNLNFKFKTSKKSSARESVKVTISGEQNTVSFVEEKLSMLITMAP